MMRSNSSAQIEDSHILKNMADHLRDLSQEVAQVAVAVSDVTADMTPSPSLATIHNLQKIDALQQSLIDLAHLSDAMACQTPLRDAALNDLKLGATRALLMHSDDRISARSGTIDIF